MHYYQFNISDYESHTKHLTEIEDLAYRRMLDWCYLHESPLPESIEEIAKKICMRTHSDCIANVLHEFFQLTESGYIQGRIQKEVAAYHAKSEKAKASAKARWSKKPNKNNKKGNDANALQSDSERNAKHKTINNKQETENKYTTKHFKEALLSNGASEIHVNDWLTVRKQKRASNTQTAMNTFMNQVKLSRLSVAQCVEIAAGNSWSGFKAEWLNKPSTTMSADTRQSFQSLHDSVRF